MHLASRTQMASCTRAHRTHPFVCLHNPRLLRHPTEAPQGMSLHAGGFHCTVTHRRTTPHVRAVSCVRARRAHPSRVSLRHPRLQRRTSEEPRHTQLHMLTFQCIKRRERAASCVRTRHAHPLYLSLRHPRLKRRRPALRRAARRAQVLQTAASGRCPSRANAASAKRPPAPSRTAHPTPALATNPQERRALGCKPAELQLQRHRQSILLRMPGSDSASVGHL
jgi:hypothetical protein